MTIPTWRQREDAAQAKLWTVVEAGVSLGFWQIARRPMNDSGNSVGVLDAEGLAFDIRTDGHDRIVAVVSSLTDHTFRVGPWDVRRVGGLVTAACSASRAPEAIARELNRRVVGSPEGKELARLVAAELARRQESRQKLLAVEKSLENLGFKAGTRDSREYYRGTAHRPGTPTASFNQDGMVSFDHVTVPMEKVRALLKLLGLQDV